jgi:hypothetical protein
MAWHGMAWHDMVTINPPHSATSTTSHHEVPLVYIMPKVAKSKHLLYTFQKAAALLLDDYGDEHEDEDDEKRICDPWRIAAQRKGREC